MKKYTIEIKGVLYTIPANSIDGAKAKARYEYHERTGTYIRLDEIIHHKNKPFTETKLF